MKKSKFTWVVYNLSNMHHLPHLQPPLQTWVAIFPAIIDDMEKKLKIVTVPPPLRAMRLAVHKG